MRFIVTTLLFFQFWCISLDGQVVIENRPEKPFVHNKKPEKPGDSFFWISPHWEWDEEASEYVWKNGFWEKKRNGYKYIPGHWRQVVGGWIWLPGKWQKIRDKGRRVFVKQPRMRRISFHLNEKQSPEIQPGVVPEKPASPVNKIKKLACPGTDYFWMNGTWHWDAGKNKYVWRHGHWAKKRPGFVYTPGRWIKIANGWKWCNGYWVRKKSEL